MEVNNERKGLEAACFLSAAPPQLLLSAPSAIMNEHERKRTRVFGLQEPDDLLPSVRSQVWRRLKQHVSSLPVTLFLFLFPDPM